MLKFMSANPLCLLTFPGLQTDGVSECAFLQAFEREGISGLIYSQLPYAFLEFAGVDTPVSVLAWRHEQARTIWQKLTDLQLETKLTSIEMADLEECQAVMECCKLAAGKNSFSKADVTPSIKANIRQRVAWQGGCGCIVVGNLETKGVPRDQEPKPTCHGCKGTKHCYCQPKMCGICGTHSGARMQQYNMLQMLKNELASKYPSVLVCTEVPMHVPKHIQEHKSGQKRCSVDCMLVVGTAHPNVKERDCIVAIELDGKSHYRAFPQRRRLAGWRDSTQESGVDQGVVQEHAEHLKEMCLEFYGITLVRYDMNAVASSMAEIQRELDRVMKACAVISGAEKKE